MSCPTVLLVAWVVLVPMLFGCYCLGLRDGRKAVWEGILQSAQHLRREAAKNAEGSKEHIVFNSLVSHLELLMKEQR